MLGRTITAYFVLLLAITWRWGLSFVFWAFLVIALPPAFIIWYWAEPLSEFTGLVPLMQAETLREAMRRRGRERKRRQKMDYEGGESVEWMNALVEQIWPHVSTYVEELILGLESTIQASVPVGIYFERCTMGKTPIQFGPIKHRSVPSFFQGKLHEDGGVALDIGLCYQSDIEVVLSTKMASVGVASVEMIGDITVLMRPFVDAPPFIGGIEVMFCSPPRVELEFRGIGNLVSLPGIYGTVRRVIDDAIAQAMVTPNRISTQLSLDPGVDLARLKNPTPLGVLRVTVLSAVSLEAKDLRLVGESTSDPYVKVTVGCDSGKTKPVMGTLAPQWYKDNVFEFLIYSTEQVVDINVLDYDAIGADDPLGCISGPVKNLLAQVGKGPVSWQLEPERDSRSSPPEDSRLTLQIDWLRLNQKLDGPEVAGTGAKYVAALKIERCDGLSESAAKYAPYIVQFRLKDSDDDQKSVSKPGWSAWQHGLTPKALDKIKLMAKNKCPAEIIAEVVEVKADVIKDFLADAKTDAMTEEESQRWIQELGAARAKTAESLHPHFEQVLRLVLNAKEVTAIVELVGGPKKQDIVGRFEVQLGSEELVSGPFTLNHPLTGEPLARLEGSVMLWRLEKAQECPVDKTKRLVTEVPMESAEAEAPAASGSGAESQPSLWSSMSGVFGRVLPPDTSSSSVPKPRVYGRVEQAMELVAGGGDKDILCGLGILRGEHDWEHARQVFKLRHGHRYSNADCLLEFVSEHLPASEDRERAAKMLHMNGIGSGEWPPRTSVASDQKPDAQKFDD